MRKKKVWDVKGSLAGLSVFHVFNDYAVAGRRGEKRKEKKRNWRQRASLVIDTTWDVRDLEKEKRREWVASSRPSQAPSRSRVRAVDPFGKEHRKWESAHGREREKKKIHLFICWLPPFLLLLFCHNISFGFPPRVCLPYLIPSHSTWPVRIRLGFTSPCVSLQTRVVWRCWGCATTTHFRPLRFSADSAHEREKRWDLVFIYFYQSSSQTFANSSLTFLLQSFLSNQSRKVDTRQKWFVK